MEYTENTQKEIERIEENAEIIRKHFTNEHNQNLIENLIEKYPEAANNYPRYNLSTCGLIGALCTFNKDMILYKNFDIGKKPSEPAKDIYDEVGDMAWDIYYKYDYQGDDAIPVEVGDTDEEKFITHLYRILEALKRSIYDCSMARFLDRPVGGNKFRSILKF